MPNILDNQQIDNNERKSFSQLFENELRTKLSSLEEIRLEVRKKSIKFYALVISSIIFCVIIYNFFGIGFSIISGVALAIFLFLMVNSLNEQKNLYISEYKNNIIKKMVENMGTTFEYSPNSSLSLNEYYESRIFEHEVDRFHGEDMITGKIDKTVIKFSEMHTEYKKEYRDSKGNKRTEWITIFKGILFIADFNKEFSHYVLVLPDYAERAFGKFGQLLQSLGTKFSDKELVKMENVEFEKLFAVYSPDQVEARYILTPLMMEKLVEFRNKVGKDIYVSFNNSNVYFAVPFNEDLFEPSVWYSVLDPAPLAQYYQVIKIMVDIVEQLNLNTRIWTKD